MQKITFGNNLKGNLYQTNNRKVGLLFLHGGGGATKERYSEIQKYLQQEGYPSFSFDFHGVGESQGHFQDGTLQQRLKDAKNAFKELQKHVDTVAVVGCSMGGHVAARLSVVCPVNALILLYAAAYAKDAEKKSLNEEFTKVLRIANSWKNSPAFSAIEQYKNDILVIYGDKDKIIPRGVQLRYKELVANKGKFLILKNAEHLFLAPKNDLQLEAKEQAFREIKHFLNNL